jgi:hypothetical protein
VETKFKLSAAQFFALNPEVKTYVTTYQTSELSDILLSDCTNLGLGAAYCVGAPPDGVIPNSTSTTGPTSTSSTPTPTPTVAAGSWTNCTSYYQVQANDNCNIIESKSVLCHDICSLWDTNQLSLGTLLVSAISSNGIQKSSLTVVVRHLP